jgi:hypothetical protein
MQKQVCKHGLTRLLQSLGNIVYTQTLSIADRKVKAGCGGLHSAAAMLLAWPAVLGRQGWCCVALQPAGLRLDHDHTSL